MSVKERFIRRGWGLWHHGESSTKGSTHALPSEATRRRRETVIPILAEEIEVEKRRVETGRVRVATVTKESKQLVDEVLTQETADIERTPIGRQVEVMPIVREEGDTIVIPIVEEVLVVERRLFLREEVRIRRTRSTKRHQERVTVRRQEAVITRLPAASATAATPSTGYTGKPPKPIDTSGDEQIERASSDQVKENIMAYETLVAVFDTSAPAKAAVDALKAGGFHENDISIFDNYRLSTATSALAQSVQEAGLWGRLFGGKVFEHEAVVYGQTVARGGTVISLRVLDSEVAHATGILDLHRPIDVHDRAVTSGIAGIARAAKVEKAAAAVAAAGITVEQRVAVTQRIAETHIEILRLAEEQLQVGKQMVETGRTRVRRFTSEREASADTTLHEEHAEVLRRAVTDPAYLGEVDWEDRTIEVVETAEQALVSKTARVVEEISLKKVGSEHVETVHEKLRRQQAQIEQIDAGERPIQPPRV